MVRTKKTTTVEENKVTTKDLDISQFMQTDYLQFAFSVLEERALPSIVDGFKPAARKVMHAALAGTTKDGKLYKLLALSGDAMRVSLYAHGDASLNSVIVGLCKYFVDNLNPLESDSQVGSLRDPDSAGSPRYLYVKHSKYMDIYKTDIDLTEQIFEEGQYVEPKYYLPIIPTILTKNNQGIAIGYAMHNQSYNPLDVIDACIECLKKRTENYKISHIIRPFVRGTKQENWRYENDVWLNYGEWKINKSKDLLTVTDLPADTSYEQFEKLLNKLQDAEYIKDWSNMSKNGAVTYELKFAKGQLSKLKEEQIINKLKLVKQVKDDLFWLLDENNKLIYFKNKYDIVKYFVKHRLNIYAQRKDKLVKIINERYKDNCDLIKFIELVCAGKLVIRNRAKVDIKKDMTKYELPFDLISTPMSRCTKEERDELLKKNKELKKELDYITKTTEKQMYINDLKKLRKDLENDFPA